MNDGGPAFPLVANFSDSTVKSGMSLRYYFAAKAMQAYIAGMDKYDEPAEFASSIAREAYIIADAMLEEGARKHHGGRDE